MFEVKVIKADFLQPGEEFDHQGEKFQVPNDGRRRAVIEAEVYGNSEHQHALLDYIFRHGSANMSDVSLEVFAKDNGHLGFMFSVEAPESEIAAQSPVSEDGQFRRSEIVHVPKSDVAEPLPEPKREDYDTQAEFDDAHQEFEEAVERDKQLQYEAAHEAEQEKAA